MMDTIKNNLKFGSSWFLSVTYTDMLRSCCFSKSLCRMFCSSCRQLSCWFELIFDEPDCSLFDLFKVDIDEQL